MLNLKFNEEGKLIFMGGQATVKDIREKGLIKATKESD